MEIAGFPVWKIEFQGYEMPKVTGYLFEAQEFVAEHC
jgi:hypothetical protein